MSRIPRRTALGLLTVGASAAAVSAFAPAGPVGQAILAAAPIPTPTPPAPSRGDALARENQQPGALGWRPGAGGTHAADDRGGQVQGYASTTSVAPGQSVDFHITVNPAQDVTVAIHRLGWYGGAAARNLLTSPTLPGTPQPVPTPDPVTGAIDCRWPVTWTLQVPDEWLSGLYLAVFTSASGWRGCTPFVVRDDQHRAEFCVVLPFSTYQAYNLWPQDGRTGKSLYYGYAPTGESLTYDTRAVKVSFDRPYTGDGMAKHLDRDHEAIQFIERQGYDVTYASTVDLHAGRVDPSRYQGLIFVGHDEYWSTAMRATATRAVKRGTSLAFLTANNVYWQIRMESAADGREHRVVTCYKTSPDPEPGQDGRERTTRWRVIGGGGAHAEQRLLGVQYNGIVAAPAPLVVRSAGHWFWAGCGLVDGDEIPRLIGGEADGFDPSAPAAVGVGSTILSASPYPLRSGALREQNSHLYETPKGAVVFTAGTLYWPIFLNRKGYADPRVQRATSNLFDRMRGTLTAPATSAAP